MIITEYLEIEYWVTQTPSAPRTILVTGGAGFIGSNLVSRLAAQGNRVLVLDINAPARLLEEWKPQIAFHKIDLAQNLPPRDLLERADAIVHLAGAPINRRWTESVKKEIYDSRVQSTANIVAALQDVTSLPEVFVSASATGFYGDRGEERLTEASPAGADFLSHVAQDWEYAARQAEAFGVRVAHVRTAPVLGEQGLLASLLPLFKWGLGGPIAGGAYWYPWVHIQDLVSIYVSILQWDEVHGPVNACAPEQVRQKEFARVLGEVLERPAVLPMPKWALSLRFGELADALTASQRVQPELLQKLGYEFQFPRLREALQQAVHSS